MEAVRVQVPVVFLEPLKFTFAVWPESDTEETVYEPVFVQETDQFPAVVTVLALMGSLKVTTISIGISPTVLAEATGEKLEIRGAVLSGSFSVVNDQLTGESAFPTTSAMLPETVTV